MGEFAYKLGLRLAHIGFIRNAIDERIDLREFRKPPTLRIFVGVSLIGLSFLTCWPAIGALGTFAVYVHKPWIVVIGGPILYFGSHGIYIAGMALSGEKYVRIFVKWVSRIGVEKLLSMGETKEAAAPESQS